MIDEDQLRHYLASHMKDSADPAGHHLSEAEIIQLFEQGRFTGGESAKLHAHLAECPSCIATFRDVRDFYDPVRAGEEDSQSATLAWPRLRARLGFTTAPAETRKVRPWGSRRFGIALPMALAAGLLLAVLCGAVWIVQLNRQQHAMSAQMEADRQSYQEQLKAAEQAANGVKEEADRTSKEYEARLQEERRRSESEKEAYMAQAKKSAAPSETSGKIISGKDMPGKNMLAIANVPIFDVFPDESIQRSGSAKRPNQVKTPAGADRFILILNGGGLVDFATYSLELANPAGTIIWRDNGLNRDQNGNFSLLLSRGITPDGSYVIRLFGTSGGNRQLIAQYQLSITD